jgi:hypothetical protein
VLTAWVTLPFRLLTQLFPDREARKYESEQYLLLSIKGVWVVSHLGPFLASPLCTVFHSRVLRGWRWTATVSRKRPFLRGESRDANILNTVEKLATL